jgi:hypothetical protein
MPLSFPSLSVTVRVLQRLSASKMCMDACKGLAHMIMKLASPKSAEWASNCRSKKAEATVPVGRHSAKELSKKKRKKSFFFER